MSSQASLLSLAERYDAILARSEGLVSRLGLSLEDILAARQLNLLHRIGILEEQWTNEAKQPHGEASAVAPCASLDTTDPGSSQAEHACVEPLHESASPTHRKLHEELLNQGISSFRFVRVPSDYYDRPLAARQQLLGAASVDHLCKSMIMENTRIQSAAVRPDEPLHPDNWADPLNSRYYIVIVQYSARLHTEKMKAVLHKQNCGSIGKQFFNMRLAPEDISDQLSGYCHNAVTPMGMAHPLPMILSHRIAELEPAFFFLGAGEVDLKVGVSTQQFLKAYNPMVVDVTY